MVKTSIDFGDETWTFQKLGAKKGELKHAFSMKEIGLVLQV